MHNIPNKALIQSLPPVVHQDRGQGVEPFNLNSYSKLLARKRKEGNVQWRRLLHDQHKINFYL